MSNDGSGSSEISARLARIESLLSADPRREQFDARGMLIAIWKGKWFVGAVALAFAVVSALVLLWLPDEYRAEAILLPASSIQGPSVSGLGGQFGGLTALAGLGLGSQGSSEKATIAIELVKTWGFIEKFIRDNGLEVEVLAARGWDPATNHLIVDRNLFDFVSNTWKSASAKGQSAEPSGWELFEALRDRIEITQDGSTGLVYLSVTYYSPAIAKELVDKLVVAINRHLQEQDQQDAQRNIEYLQKQIDRTSLTEMKAIFFNLIEEQTKNLMLAEVSSEYALRTIGSAKVPEKKFRPNRVVICTLATLLGGILGTFVWLSFLYRREP